MPQRVEVCTRNLGQPHERGLPPRQQFRQRNPHFHQEFIEWGAISQGQAGGERERHLPVDDRHGKGKF